MQCLQGLNYTPPFSDYPRAYLGNIEHQLTIYNFRLNVEMNRFDLIPERIINPNKPACGTGRSKIVNQRSLPACPLDADRFFSQKSLNILTVFLNTIELANKFTRPKSRQGRNYGSTVCSAAKCRVKVSYHNILAVFLWRSIQKQ